MDMEASQQLSAHVFFSEIWWEVRRRCGPATIFFHEARQDVPLIRKFMR
jgi:hypothetical protein